MNEIGGLTRPLTESCEGVRRKNPEERHVNTPDPGKVADLILFLPPILKFLLGFTVSFPLFVHNIPVENSVAGFPLPIWEKHALCGAGRHEFPPKGSPINAGGIRRPPPHFFLRARRNYLHSRTLPLPSPRMFTDSVNLIPLLLRPGAINCRARTRDNPDPGLSCEKIGV